MKCAANGGNGGGMVKYREDNFYLQRKADRRQIRELLVNCIEREAKEQWGVEFILTVCGNIHMENIHKKLGWYVDKTAPAYETIKYL